MHRAVRPNPVAAALATSRASGPSALERSLTRPVAGSAASQKNKAQARSSSSRNLSSAAEKDAGYFLIFSRAFAARPEVGWEQMRAAQPMAMSLMAFRRESF